MKKIAIISANPVEFYPPLWNLLRDQRWQCHRVWCYTMYSRKYPWSKFSTDGIRIVRTQQHSWKFSVLNLMDRLWFSLRVLLGLLFTHPDKILYIESNSALPVYWYKRYFNRKVEVFIHYYEYSDPLRYAKVRWDGWCHKLERYLYLRMVWCSHCNQKRLELSCKDWGLTTEKQHIVPNYPPLSWQGRISEAQRQAGTPLKLVYVGSLSLETMFVQEVTDWVMQQKGAVTIDFYAFNCNEETKAKLLFSPCPWVRFHGGIPYDRQPEELSKYDVGLILYKAIAMNYKYNECNKFFEYLTCGLDVWFSSRIELLQARANGSSIPKIAAVDFEHLGSFNWRETAHREGVTNAQYSFVAETANTELIEMLLQ